MAIAASSVTPTNSLEDFRIEFNNLVSDVSGITATNVFTENIIFEGATADSYETTLAVTDPTADRTLTLPNATGTVVIETSSGVVINEDSADVDFRVETDDRTHMFFVDGGNDNITIDAGNVLSGAAGDGVLHITKGTAGSVTANTTFDELVIESNTHAGITILTPASSTGGIVFGDPDDNDIGSIQYDHATDKLTFVIAASTEMQMTTAAIFPNSADGLSLGLASNEFSDLYLADSGIIYFGNDQEITLTHSADSGLLLKHTATADDKPINLTLQTGETDIAQDDVLGKISFQAPDEGTGTDAILVAAAIQAVSEGDFSSSSNATSLQFMTGSSEAATAKVYFDSTGNVGIGESSPSSYYGNTRLVISDTTSGETAALTLRSATDGVGFIAFADSNSGNARFAGYVEYQHSSDLLSFGIAQSAEVRLSATAFYPSSADGTALGLSTNEWSDLFLADGAVINFGNDQEVTLTHVADTGLLLSSTDQLQFGDSGTYIHQSADGVLDLVSDTEIEINATTIDINGNVEISGDLTVSGDDITMGTNTSGAVLVADGTNFNPVVVSGDATIATNGALTIAATSVEGSMLNNNVISGQTALTSGLASTDELLVSDAGTLKRVDVSLVTDQASGDATALAIALG